jgi:dienelactone hydrolase
MARRLVRHSGLAAAAIDGPVHGDRSHEGGSDTRAIFLRFAQAWSSDDTMTDEMVADYVATLDALQSFDEIGPGPAGWWGLSMGTILGLPFVAAEPRITVAVLGCMGLTGPTRERIAADAPLVGCPVLFLAQWDDELFARDTAFALFDALGSKDKRLHASPGTHGAVPDEEFLASEQFLAKRLARSP